MFSGRLRELKKIEVRLTLGHALLFALVILAALTVAYFVASKRLIERDKDNILFRIGLYASEYQRGGLDAVKEVASLRKGRSQRAAFLRVADSANRTVFLRDEPDWGEFLPQELSQTSIASLSSKGFREIRSKDGDVLMLAHVILTDGFLMELGITDEETRLLLSTIRATTLILTLLTLPLSLFGGFLLASRTLAPLSQITKTATEIVETANIGARVPFSPKSSGPMSDLVALFNRMLERIDRLVQGMRESLDNVAHDLRTPIAKIQNRAQHALTGQADETALRETLADCVEETRRVSSILNTLMDIAEAEATIAPHSRRPINLSSLLETATDLYREVAEEKRISVELHLPESLPLQGDSPALLRTFANLLDNAIKYTPKGGVIRVTGTTSETGHQISFTDNGIGISQEDLPQIWNRLFRGDRSRTERGLGLGLAYVRAVVEGHRGTVSALSELGKGTCITLTFPS